MDPSTHTEQALRARRDALYHDAQADPNSEAAEMVRVLLLEGLSSLQPEICQEEAGALLSAERRHYQLRQEAEASDAQASDEIADEAADEAGFQTEEWKMRLQEVAQAIQAAQDGRMDRQKVYDRIAEIVGLRKPAGEEPEVRIEPGAGNGEQGA